jgi:WD40 repeat protein
MVPSSNEPYAAFNEPSGPVLGLAVVSNQILAVGCWNGLVKLWDVRTRQVRGQLDAHCARTLALACSPDGRTLAVGYEDKNKREPAVVLWDLLDRRQVGDLSGARGPFAMDFTPDGQTLALASRARRGLIVWDTGDRRERIVLGDRLETVRSLAISPDGRTVATGCRDARVPDGKIRLWNLQTGRVETILEGHQREVQALAFQPNGDLLASGSRDGVVRLWSLPTGDEVRTLSGKFKEVRCLTFSPDGRTLATSHGGMVVLWDVATGKQRSTLKAHKFAITALAYLPDGRTLATAGWDRTVKLWDLQPAE